MVSNLTCHDHWNVLNSGGQNMFLECSEQWMAVPAGGGRGPTSWRAEKRRKMILAIVFSIQVPRVAPTHFRRVILFFHIFSHIHIWRKGRGRCVGSTSCKLNILLSLLSAHDQSTVRKSPQGAATAACTSMGNSERKVLRLICVCAMCVI